VSSVPGSCAPRIAACRALASRSPKCKSKPGQAGLGRVAVCRQSQARRPLSPARKRIHRVPTHFAVVQMERGLRNLNIVGQISAFQLALCKITVPLRLSVAGLAAWSPAASPWLAAGRWANCRRWAMCSRRRPAKGADRNTLGRQPRALGAQVYNHRVPSQRIQRGGVRVARHMRQFPCRAKLAWPRTATR